MSKICMGVNTGPEPKVKVPPYVRGIDDTSLFPLVSPFKIEWPPERLRIKGTHGSFLMAEYKRKSMNKEKKQDKEE